MNSLVTISLKKKGDDEGRKTSLLANFEISIFSLQLVSISVKILGSGALILYTAAYRR